MTDTGVGIPAECLDRLFMPFSQVDSSTARKFGGTGLGLYICKQLVELMDGEIGVSSQVGVGSTFWFEVPLDVRIETGLTAFRKHHMSRQHLLIVGRMEGELSQICESLHAWECKYEQVSLLTEAELAIDRVSAAGRPFSAVLADCRPIAGDEYDRLQQLAEKSRLPIIGLGRHPDDAAADYLQGLGVRHLLCEPVRPSTLFDALCSLLSAAAPETAGSETADNAAQSERVPLSGHVLVAEDNHINQMFVVELLKHCGCTCDIVANGDDALSAVQEKAYSLILMDCQMPEMDGFTATREIRRREAEESSSMRVPIIALTANALKGDRERCLEAGMDDYLSKPLQVEKLHAALLRNLSPPSGRPRLESLRNTGPSLLEMA